MSTETTERENDCFVAMPIKKSGSDEYRHFEAIYANIAEVAQSVGYSVLRADKVSTPGNITKDIITRLAVANVVIADLSDLNPNVFYEVGLRHALRRNGTVLMIDKARSPVIPFDLSQYRVVTYEGDLAGVQKMRADLREILSELFQSSEGDSDSSLIDSPLHDWFPELPSNIIETSKGSTDRDLTLEIVDLRRQLQLARELQKPDGARGGAVASSFGLLESLRQAAQSGELVHDYVARAEQATDLKDIPAFLDCVEKLFRSRETPDIRIYYRFGNWATILGLRELRIAILKEASAKIPGKDTRADYLRALAGSAEPDERQVAMSELALMIGVDVKSGALSADAAGANLDRNLSHFVDLLHTEGEDELGLTILDQAIARPDKHLFERLYARQLDWLNDLPAALSAYKSGIMSPYADQQSFRWFANFMHNNGLHVESAELFLLEAYFDLDDPNGALHFADEIAFHLYDFFALQTPPELLKVIGEARAIPNSVGRQEILDACAVALSTGSMDPAQTDTLQRVITRADIRELTITEKMGKPERIEWMRKVYGEVQSPLTAGSPVGARLLE